MTYTPLNFADKLTRFKDHWSPKIIAQMNGELTAKDGVWV